jgi:hypothetical protein
MNGIMPGHGFTGCGKTSPRIASRFCNKGTALAEPIKPIESMGLYRLEKLVEWSEFPKNHPQGLKPRIFIALIGTTEVVP